MMTTDTKKTLLMNYWILGSRLSLYIIACLCPAFTTEGTAKWPGWACVAFGWMSFGSNPLQGVIWGANVIYLQALWKSTLHLLNPLNAPASVWAFVAALLIGLSFLFKKTIDGDVSEEITRTGVGYWLWLLSFAVPVAYKLWMIGK